MFEGVHTALVTPFRDGKLDEVAFRKLIDMQFDNGASGIVPVGTTGESPTLTHDEHERVIAIAVEHTAKRGLVIAGTGSNATAEAIALTQSAEKAGADASLQVCPYYNKPSQAGLFAHYKAVADATALPIVLYSIPGRCGIEISVETTANLASSCSNIRSMKEAGGTPERVSQLVHACPENFEVVSGDDSMTLPFMSVGAVGVISVAGNLIPKVMSDLVAAANSGDYASAQALHRKYYGLFSAFLKLDTNPVPIKTALALRGDVTEELRLPMIPMEAGKKAELRSILEELGLL
ncbi:MAG: 4-hydroxy-tetrahydrodipicolinate synthase [Verrucomicrobiales bacterium]|jgi:4-hydroxy-tetrahydrodipicolinate synthase